MLALILLFVTSCLCGYDNTLMGTTERKEREKETRKEAIIDAAQKVFFEKGLHLATMEEIAETAELAKGTLYLYYHSKEDLYLAVTMRGLDILRRMFKEVMDKKTTFVHTLVELTETYTTFYEQHKEYFRMLHFFNTPSSHTQVSEEMMRSCSEFNQMLWTMVIEFLRKGTAEHKLRADLNPIEIAVIMWSNTTTLLMRIDSQLNFWKERMNINLRHTLDVSYQLMLESVLTAAGQNELKEILTTRNK
jgi:TetR/AcrR family transcriptional regulator